MRALFWFLLFTASFEALAQQAEPSVPTVPHKINFAGITLSIRDDARKEIQKDVDALWQSPKHIQLKAERARTYFPIIEKIFSEERVPDDFKYLVLQESALIADAVSVSNAVGFWQFKDFTAMEVGLRVDEWIDERMNIYASTRAAARYIKRNNYQFNNWVYALQAYQMGAGGVLRSVEDINAGARHVEITSATYWYVKKFIAHKIAFENIVVGAPPQSITTHEVNTQYTVDELVDRLSVEKENFLMYNKWIRKDIIPDDRPYVVVIPNPHDIQKTEPSMAETPHRSISAPFPVQNEIHLINGIVVHYAKPGESSLSFATRLGIPPHLFLEYNDLQENEQLRTGVPYFTARKKSRAEQETMVASKTDNLWTVSQRYGVVLEKLKKYNHTKEIFLREGQSVWLSSKMPKKLLESPSINSSVQITDERFYNWDTPTAYPDTLIISLYPSNDQQPTEAFHSASSNVHTIISDTITPTRKHHIVQPGENLYTISKNYGLTIDQIRDWNNLGNNLDLIPGQQLNLQDTLQPTEHKLNTTHHEVKPSDTLYGIARLYGVTIKELMDWNGKKDFILTVGEKLRVVR